MLVLGIETSCDETSFAIVENGSILVNLVSSSLEFHKQYGGIIPEAASRYHLEYIVPLLDKTLKSAKIKLKDLDLIAVTFGPGLLGSLMIGINFAKTIAFTLKIPLIPVNHILAHLYAPFLNKGEKPRLPAVGLVVSGGHTELIFINDFNNLELLGKTRDDACGEAFDKVARILELGFPGGPFIEKRAKEGKARIKFKCAYLKDSLDFSFSGIKTAVLYYVKKIIINRGKLTLNEVNDICASFQEAVFEVLIDKAREACQIKGVSSLIVGGGVSANLYLQEKMEEMGRKEGIRVFFPEKGLSLDNAAIVAGLGYRLYRLGEKRGDFSLEPAPFLKIGGGEICLY